MDYERIKYGCTFPLFETCQNIINEKTYDFPKEIDLSLPPGGMANYYLTGIFFALKALIDRGDLVVKRYFGTSSGAIGAVGLACNFDGSEWKKAYTKIYQETQKGKYLMECYELVLRDCLPKDAYKICSNKVFIHAKKITLFGLKDVVFYKYNSNEELLDCLLASTRIPFLTHPDPWKTIKGSKYIDGIDYCPFNIIRPTLIIKLPDDYTYYKRINPVDYDIDCLILRGFNDMRRFLEIKICHQKLIKLKTTTMMPKYVYNKNYYILFISLLLFWFNIE